MAAAYLHHMAGNFHVTGCCASWTVPRGSVEAVSLAICRACACSNHIDHGRHLLGAMHWELQGGSAVSELLRGERTSRRCTGTGYQVFAIWLRYSVDSQALLFAHWPRCPHSTITVDCTVPNARVWPIWSVCTPQPCLPSVAPIPLVLFMLMVPLNEDWVVDCQWARGS